MAAHDLSMPLEGQDDNRKCSYLDALIPRRKGRRMEESQSFIIYFDADVDRPLRLVAFAPNRSARVMVKERNKAIIDRRSK